MLSLLLIGCEERYGQPSQKVVMPLSICLPMDEVKQVNQSPVRRVMGDPGMTETFLFPNYIYIIVLKQVGDNWVLWHAIEETVANNDWQPTRYEGLLQTTGDSIYQYTEEIELLLNNEKFVGRVYAIASAVPLTFNRSLNSISNLDEALTLTFDASSVEVQESVQHIYATPYNYEVDAKYYGTFSSIAQKVPHVNLLFYHVASKVDLKWYVPENKRINNADPSSAVRLTSMKACNLFAGNAYCFKPMENSSASPVTTSDTIEIVRPADAGLWWEGRYYFYTIPYTTTGKTGYFPLQMQLETNESGNLYSPTIYLQVNTASPFVPWLRADFNLNIPLNAGTDTKTIDN